jgi:aldehyde:ferredoxin oxidoreductase
MDNLSSNKIAVIDLTTGQITEESLDEDLVQEKIGGAGINTFLFHKYQADAPIVLGSGLLTGTLVPGAALAVMTAQSPRTGALAHAPFTLYAGMELKFSGFDYLVIKGKSEKPVYLWLHDGIADLEPAQDLWGNDVWMAVEKVRKTVGDDLVQVLAIGPAGESGALVGQVSNNFWASGDHWGFGALFGEKNLKLLAVRGMGLLEIADPEPFVGLCLDLLKTIKSGAWAGKEGMGELLVAAGEADGSAWLSPIIHRHKACFNTPVATNSFVFLDEDPKRLSETDETEPGILLTDLPGLLGFKKLGLSALEAGRLLKMCAQRGLDPAAVSGECLRSGVKDFKAVEASLGSLKGTAEAGGFSGPFSSWAPRRPLGVDFGLPADGSGLEAWWLKRQALAYLFGIHPLFMLMAPEMSQDKLLELAGVGSGLTFTPEALEEAITFIGR